MRPSRWPRTFLACAWALCLAAVSSTGSGGAAAQGQEPEWVRRSNENAQILLKVRATFAPESAGRDGVPGLDEEITQFPPDQRTRLRASTRDALQQLERRLASEQDPLVAQDLRILIKSAQNSLTAIDFSERSVPYFNVAQIVFGGVRALLDDQVPAERRQAALVRLRKYSGLEPRFQPLAEQARARSRDWSR